MKKFIFFTVFSTGMTALALEMSASRLLGSVFGTSNLVWATVIGMILVYLAVGYWIGGKWADRQPKYTTIFSIVTWAAFLSGLVPFLARPVLRLAADAFDSLKLGILFGSFAAVIILLSLPVILLGMVSPFSIRLVISGTESSGHVSGNLYALSTIGSFIGTFLPPLLLIPLFGTTLTFVIFSLYLLMVGFGGLWLAGARKQILFYIWMPVLILLLMFWWKGHPIKNTQGQIYETESAYNYIQVLEIDGYHLLRLNEGQGVHSYWHPQILDYAGSWEQFLVAPFFNPAPYSSTEVRRMAIIGLAGGTSACQATAVFGSIPIDGFEIDPKIIEVGRKYFGMTMSNLQAIPQDGRWGLANSEQNYQLIALDAYRPPYIPWHLTTKEFFEEIRSHLTEDGAIAMNVGSDPQDQELIPGLVGTLQSVFPSVYLMEIPGTFNFIIYATVQPSKVENIYLNYLYLSANKETHPLLLTAISRFIENQRNLPQKTMVFTDDWAPIEYITNNLVLKYIFSEDLETLR